MQRAVPLNCRRHFVATLGLWWLIWESVTAHAVMLSWIRATEHAARAPPQEHRCFLKGVYTTAVLSMIIYTSTDYNYLFIGLLIA